MTALINRFLKQIIGINPKHQIQYSCQTEHHGSVDDGWTICPVNIDKNSIVYSVGIGQEISFDLSLITKYQLKIYAFDPTPKSLAWLKAQTISKKFIVHPWGLADFDGSANFTAPKNTNHMSYRMEKKASNKAPTNLPVFRLKTIMQKFGHKQIDILKLDIEGAEYPVLNDIIKSNISIQQVLVEFHHRFYKQKKLTEEIVKRLNKRGFLIYHISRSGDEYSFINPKPLP